MSITSYDVLPQDDICKRCHKRIGDHTQEELWKCLQDLSLFAGNIQNNVRNWVG